MRPIIVASIALLMGATAPSRPRANFLRIAVTAPDSTLIHAIWRPYAGAVSSRGENQQAALRARNGITNPDSAKRWLDPNARDTIVVKAPAEFMVDMGGGPIVIETTGDSIRVEAQLTPSRGPVAAEWGKSFVVESNGITPSITRRLP